MFISQDFWGPTHKVNLITKWDYPLELEHPN